MYRQSLSLAEPGQVAHEQFFCDSRSPATQSPAPVLRLALAGTNVHGWPDQLDEHGQRQGDVGQYAEQENGTRMASHHKA